MTEVPADDPPSLVHAEWLQRFPWLIQGTTRRRGRERLLFDLGLFTGASDESEVRGRWEDFARATGAKRVMHAEQVHEAHVRIHDHLDTGPVTPALRLVGSCDGHVTAVPGVVLAVTAADCVPVFVVDAERRAVAALHAGWRGAAAGVLEEGLDMMRAEFGTRSEDVHLHFGPSICSECYEVGPEVFDAFDLVVPPAPQPIDLKGILAERAVQRGVPAERISISTHCTRCTDSELFSHRGGDAGRQVGFLGVRHGPDDSHGPDALRGSE